VFLSREAQVSSQWTDQRGDSQSWTASGASDVNSTRELDADTGEVSITGSVNLTATADSSTTEFGEGGFGTQFGAPVSGGVRNEFEISGFAQANVSCESAVSQGDLDSSITVDFQIRDLTSSTIVLSDCSSSELVVLDAARYSMQFGLSIGASHTNGAGSVSGNVQMTISPIR
jgi:hypothetical protein